MEKIKVTEKDMRNYKNIIEIGYCEAQYLLKGLTPNFYTSGIYGWKADYYQYDYNTIIATGYSPINGIRKYDLIRKYDEKAEKIYHDFKQDYNITIKKINKLLDKFINECLESEVK